jgi:flagellar biosynthetic protein FliQ
MISVFQAATQINEMTMTFIPKMLAVAVALLLSFPWMLQVLIDFMQTLIVGLPQTIR